VRDVTTSDYGASPVVVDLPTPAAGPDQVLIKLVLGVDGAGIVDALDEGATRVSPGDRVFGQWLVSSAPVPVLAPSRPTGWGNSTCN
jgi:NADPH:quinone reductase-like Zn-dependent oxidoreductase